MVFQSAEYICSKADDSDRTVTVLYIVVDFIITSEQWVVILSVIILEVLHVGILVVSVAFNASIIVYMVFFPGSLIEKVTSPWG